MTDGKQFLTTEEIRALEGKNEMDAIVAYMQKLGSDIDWRDSAAVVIAGAAMALSSVSVVSNSLLLRRWRPTAAREK